MLGTFVLVTFVLLPYYLRQPSLEGSGDAGNLVRLVASGTELARSYLDFVVGRNPPL
jgi:hypothetical protein